MKPKRRYCLIGTGNRARFFVEGIAQRHRDNADLVALCDTSRVRMTYYQKLLEGKYSYGEVPAYQPVRFNEMLEECRPDAIIVSTPDFTHHEYILKALRANIEPITEKPITIDDSMCREILEQCKKSNRKVRVCFNYRWGPGPTKVKQLIKEGIIGGIKQINLVYLLNTRHGADYFRRWHSYKENSGGLLVHKATHHFDLVNWWIDSIPSEIFSFGQLSYYGKNNAIARGEKKLTTYERYLKSTNDEDPFRFDLRQKNYQELYREAETETGYIRDRNVFRDDISIEDTMGVLVKYRNGALLNYSLNCFSPYEGLTVSFSGDKGRLEYTEFHGGHILNEHFEDDPSARGRHKLHLKVWPLFKPSREIAIDTAAGGHGGGDPLLLDDVFGQNPQTDRWDRGAYHEQGIASAIIGIAANKSMKNRQIVRIHDLISLRPDAVRLSQLF